MNALIAIYAIWIGLFILWIVSGAFAKASVRRESPGSRLPHLAIMVVAFLLLFDRPIYMGPLSQRFIADTTATQGIGLAMTIAGAAFAIWARLSIGSNWSGNVTIKQDHELKRDGPYAIVRHPIYSGLLLAMLGTAIAIGEWRGLAGLALALIGWRMKSLVEERFMREQFGEQYIAYQRDVKALIPFVL